jgi:branched-chain amino acid transport system ATP-binding protein
MLVVEHDMQFVGELCDRVIVLNFGRKIAEGTPNDVRNDAAVREAYFGSDDSGMETDHAS